MRPSYLFALVTLACASTWTQAAPTDMPKRKAGLWEIKTSMAGMPSMGPILHCIDEKTDNFYRQMGQDASSQCSSPDIKRDGDRVTVHSVCNMGKTKATTDAVFSGKFDSAYRGDIKVSYDPPLHNMAQSQMVVEAKWTGACKANQKPGDIVMPNGMTMNPSQMQGGPGMGARMR